MSDGLRKFIATGLGTGYLRPAPGSWASAAACLMLAGVLFATGGDAVAFNAVAVVLAIGASVACVKLGRFAQETFGKKDPGQSTLDEWAGQAVTLLGLPLASGQNHWLVAIWTGFLLFRLFDSIKPPPLRRLEKLPFGWGVLVDDLAAGVYSNVCNQLLLRLWILPAMGGGVGGSP